MAGAGDDVSGEHDRPAGVLPQSAAGGCPPKAAPPAGEPPGPATAPKQLGVEESEQREPGRGCSVEASVERDGAGQRRGGARRDVAGKHSGGAGEGGGGGICEGGKAAAPRRRRPKSF